MGAATKTKIQETIQKIEANFQHLLENKDVKKVLADMRKMKNKRTKQIDKMLGESWSDIKAGYAKEVKAMERLYTKEKKRVNAVFKDQLAELANMKKAIQSHMGPAKTGSSKKAPAKKAMKAKKATKKVAAKRKVAAPVARETQSAT